jgi:tyrosinase
MPAPAPGEDLDLVPAEAEAGEATPPSPPEVIGATTAPTPLGAVTTSTTVSIGAPQGPRRESFGEADIGPGGTRVFLKLEGITGTRRGAGSFDVFLNVPPGADPATLPDRRVGRVATFGVPEASVPGAAHAGSGISDTFEITDIVRSLQASSGWDPAQVRVSFRPVPSAAGTIPEGDVTVGRVSVFVA